MFLHNLLCFGCNSPKVSIGIGTYFAYKYMNRNKENFSKYDYVYQATNY